MTEDRRAARMRRITELFTDETMAAAAPDPAVIELLRTSTLRLAELVDAVMTTYADRPACAERATESVIDGSGRRGHRLLPGYRTISYGELWARAGAIAAAWQHDETVPLQPGEFVATVGFTSADYTAIDLACLRAGAVNVPMPSTVPVAQWNSILAETGAHIWMVSQEAVRTAAEGLSADSPVRTMVVFDHDPDDEIEQELLEVARRALAASGARVRLTTLDALVALGRELPAPLVVSGDPDPLHLLMYTSGSTGTPKGAMYTERLAAGFWRGAGTFTQGRASSPAIGLHYMPLGHLMGRGVLFGALARGGTAYFSAGSDVSTLLEDTALVRPAELFVVPRVCDLLYQRYLGEVDRRTAVGIAPEVAAAEALTEVRDRVLGGRVVTTLCGSAPLTAAMRQFMEELLGIEMHDGYGSTEAGGRIMLDNRIRRPPVLDYKLADVPELGYFGTDKPHPRGELLLKSALMIPGYFRRPELTDQIFDADGFYRTGDIVAELEPDHLIYVDRRNNVLKLAQGEFVAINRLEALYVAAPSVRQIYLYGNSERSYLLAVIVPTEQAQVARVTKGEIAVELRGVAHEAELNSYEIPRDFLIETEPFTAAGGLLSSMGKPLRPKLGERYGMRLEQLYTDLDTRRSAQLAELVHEADSRPVVATVCRAAEVLLGTTTLPDQQFADLGGDSLAALSFSQLLQEIFGVTVPVGAITGPDTDLRRIAAYVVAEQNAADHRPTVASVHGLGSRLVAAHLLLDKFLDPATLAVAPTVPRAPHPPRSVLLTGANGYLGRFLALELLRQLEPAGATLVCLVRGRDTESAAARLDSVFDADDTLRADYRIAAAGRCRVVAGDVAAPNFGLSEADWQELTESVDLVVHAAALVNHVLPYAQLFGPNVVGTAEVIRFALTATIKPIAFLSTVAVAGQAGRDGFDEDGDIRYLSPVRSVDAGYASGYGNSKWAGEVLLREAHELCGLPVTVFRSDMILAHPDYAGQFNAGDMFSRLLFSVLATGLAPSSFYLPDPSGARPRAHYDGLPVDFTAAAIATLALAVDTGFRTYDVLNPHDDGISLDEFVDWLIESGEPIERIDGFERWSDRLETALRALPDRQRQASVLPLLHAFRHPARPVAGSLLPAEKFRAAVQEAGIGPAADIPHLTRDLILKYAADLRLRGLL